MSKRKGKRTRRQPSASVIPKSGSSLFSANSLLVVGVASTVLGVGWLYSVWLTKGVGEACFEPAIAIIAGIGAIIAARSERCRAKAPIFDLFPRMPVNAEFMFYLFMSPQDADAITGDLAERCKKLHTKFGKRKADFHYWTQCYVSISPIVWAWLKRVVLKPLLWLVALVTGKSMLTDPSWFAGLVEWVRKIRT